MKGLVASLDVRRLVRSASIVLFLLLTVTSTTLPPTGAASAASSPLPRNVILTASNAATAEELVEAFGGEVYRRLPLIDGVAASLTPEQLERAMRVPGVSVSPDASVSFQGAAANETSHRIQKIVRSDRLWEQGIDGSGVTVALLDTGVYAGHPDLQGPSGSRVVHCEDLSHERGTQAHCADTFGHGTFMAGLIAGNGASSGGRFVGASPQAKIVSVKAAGFDGSTDISTILAGIQWVVSHRDTYDITALNLSLGSDSDQDYRLSPLNFAVEKAWDAGIVVVVSAGNSGPGSATVMKPGDDPFVITVGASNDEGSMAIGDDRVPVFSSRGPTRSNGLAKPDIVSPGVHTVSLRSPGSAIDQQFGVDARVGDHYFKGTGTSMATATVTGIVAQVLERNPSLSPDQVKARLVDTARAIAETDPYAAGRGLVDAYAAAMSDSTRAENQGIERSTGLGTLQADRGSVGVNVQTPLGSVELLGEYTAQLDPDGPSLNNPTGLSIFSAVTYTTTGWDPLTWDGTNWKTDDWTGTNWKGTNWKATVWDGTNWKGTNWKNEDWTGTNWKGVNWDGTNWKATSWQSAWYAAAWD
ncbi:MAG: S8 family serine peptidase [Actinomycetota bacterium]